MKAVFANHGRNAYAYRVEGLPQNYYALDGRQFDHAGAVKAFRDGVRTHYVDAKRKGTLAAVRKYVKDFLPADAQFYACWRADSPSWKDDCVELLVKLPA